MTTIGIGFIPLPALTPERTRQAARAALSDCADREGVALRHVYEPPGINADQTRAALTSLQDVAAMHSARTLVVYGPATADLITLTRTAELRLISVPGPGHRRPTEPRWCGKVEVDLLNGRGWRVQTVELDVQDTTIIMTLNGFTLAELDRGHFRDWLTDPTEPLDVGSVSWFTQAGSTQIEIDRAVPRSVSGETMQRLAAMI